MYGFPVGEMSYFCTLQSGTQSQDREMLKFRFVLIYMKNIRLNDDTIIYLC